jgi:hypothetical protein
MTKFTAFIIIVALRIVYHPSDAQSGIAPFASPTQLPASRISIAPAKLISITGSISDHKVILNWVVGENETADQFEVEKSTDGKNFTMAALVFGTDLPETGNYRFYEKAGNEKTLYRIKLINKNRQAEYSAVIEINPNV